MHYVHILIWFVSVFILFYFILNVMNTGTATTTGCALYSGSLILSKTWHGSCRNSAQCDEKCRELEFAHCGICQGWFHSKCFCRFPNWIPRSEECDKSVHWEFVTRNSVVNYIPSMCMLWEVYWYMYLKWIKICPMACALLLPY